MCDLSLSWTELFTDLKDRSGSADSSGEEDSDEEEDRSMNNDTAPDQVYTWLIPSPLLTQKYILIHPFSPVPLDINLTQSSFPTIHSFVQPFTSNLFIHS